MDLLELMKPRYRIVKIYDTDKTYYTVQKKILGLWFTYKIWDGIFLETPEVGSFDKQLSVKEAVEKAVFGLIGDYLPLEFQTKAYAEEFVRNITIPKIPETPAPSKRQQKIKEIVGLYNENGSEV